MSNSRKFSWFKHSNVLPNTTGIVRHSTFLRLNFPSLREEDSGMYKCNITDDKNIWDKSFQPIVLKTGVHHAIFLVLEVKRSKILQKLNKKDCFCLHSSFQFLWHFTRKN